MLALKRSVSSLKVFTFSCLVSEAGRDVMARPAVPDSKLMPTAAAVHERHRTGPIPETLTQVNGYPKKLKIYRLEASPYWWVRTFHNGKIYRRSTKTDVKRDAMSIARAFFDEVVSGRVLTEPKKQDKPKA